MLFSLYTQVLAIPAQDLYIRTCTLYMHTRYPACIPYAYTGLYTRAYTGLYTVYVVHTPYTACTLD